MQYYSLNRNATEVNFREAVKNGLAPDSGLYFPKTITPLESGFFDNIENLSNSEIGFQAIRQFVGEEIPETELRKIVEETLNFPFPVVKVEEDIFSLELFHGPTLAFKDVGARFMARCLAYFNKGDKNQRNTVLVATSGDTGGAVASGFLGVDGVDVVILYPAGKVSDVQERQLTTLGRNIVALKVNGVFDDSQDMVKKAFLDRDLAHRNLTSANSINIARWLPQMFYFFFAYRELKKSGRPLIVSCPSGNFGNICAGILAKRLGLPINYFVAATNVNDTVPRFLEDWIYDPKPSQATISNAMDVGNPSNFVRIRELYRDNRSNFEQDFSAYSFTDYETMTAMQKVFMQTSYVLEPHGAVGFLGLKKKMKVISGAVGVLLETAHPVKFLETVDNVLGVQPKIPQQIIDLMIKEKNFTEISNYGELKSFLNQ